MSTRPAAFDIMRKERGHLLTHMPGFSQLWIFFLIITYPIRKLDYTKIIGDAVGKAIQYWVKNYGSVLNIVYL